ncbi:hypothetical protein [Gordonia sp. MMO-8]|uniref:hypothetical protein n=1 Tax=Gordonia sp. MMO-8 TaxID=3127886 RepID=UPI003018B545
MTQQWRESFNDRIAETAKSVRERNNWSAREISDRTKELGYPISRDTITNFEIRRKKVLDVPELIVLAEALYVDPLLLLFPDLVDGKVEYMPGRVVSTGDALRLFAGMDENLNTPLRTFWDYESLRQANEERDAKRTLDFGVKYYGWTVED